MAYLIGNIPTSSSFLFQQIQVTDICIRDLINLACITTSPASRDDRMAEAESLIRRALAISQVSLGLDPPYNPNCVSSSGSPFVLDGALGLRLSVPFLFFLASFLALALFFAGWLRCQQANRLVPHFGLLERVVLAIELEKFIGAGLALRAKFANRSSEYAIRFSDSPRESIM